MLDYAFGSDDLLFLLCHDSFIYKKLYYPYDKEYLFHYFTTPKQKDILIFYHFYIQYRKFDMDDCYKFFLMTGGRIIRKERFRWAINRIYLIENELEKANLVMDIDKIFNIRTGNYKFTKGCFE